MVWVNMSQCDPYGCRPVKLAEEKAMLNVEVIKDEDDDDSPANKFTTPVRAFAISPLELRGSISDNLGQAWLVGFGC
ncbi:hypothetical protein Tco_1205097 [Tanacetum coccineum]